MGTTDHTADIDYRLFGRHLRFLRQQADLSQSDLAERVEVSLNTISAWETGDRVGQPKRPFVARLDRALDAHGALLERAGYAATDQLPTDPRYDGTITDAERWFRWVIGRLREYEAGDFVPPTTTQIAAVDTTVIADTVARFAAVLADRIDDDYGPVARLLADQAKAVADHVAAT